MVSLQLTINFEEVVILRLGVFTMSKVTLRLCWYSHKVAPVGTELSAVPGEESKNLSPGSKA